MRITVQGQRLRLRWERIGCVMVVAALLLGLLGWSATNLLSTLQVMAAPVQQDTALYSYPIDDAAEGMSDQAALITDLTVSAQPNVVSDSSGKALRHAVGNDHRLAATPSISVQTIEHIFIQYNSPWQGQAMTLWQLGVQHGIDPAYALGFAVQESRVGTAHNAAPSAYWGIKCYPDDYPTMACKNGYSDPQDFQQGAAQWYQHITGSNYCGGNRCTPETIIPIYAPGSVDNNLAPHLYISHVNDLVAAWRAAEADFADGASSSSAQDGVTSLAVPDIQPETSCAQVTLQVGHWHENQLPAELAELRGQTGTSGGGVAEWQLALTVAQSAATALRAKGYQVAIIPATVPENCQAAVFLAIHADGTANSDARGFKLAAPDFFTHEANDTLVVDLYTEYRAATGLPTSPSITRNMTRYYAFWGGTYTHAVDRATPMALIELGYLTNAADRQLLYSQPDRAASGIAAGLDRFLREKGAAQ